MTQNATPDAPTAAPTPEAPRPLSKIDALRRDLRVKRGIEWVSTVTTRGPLPLSLVRACFMRQLALADGAEQVVFDEIVRRGNLEVFTPPGRTEEWVAGVKGAAPSVPDLEYLYQGWAVFEAEWTTPDRIVKCLVERLGKDYDRPKDPFMCAPLVDAEDRSLYGGNEGRRFSVETVGLFKELLSLGLVECRAGYGETPRFRRAMGAAVIFARTPTGPVWAV